MSKIPLTRAGALRVGDRPCFFSRVVFFLPIAGVTLDLRQFFFIRKRYLGQTNFLLFTPKASSNGE